MTSVTAPRSPVLVVDDDELLCEVIAALLASDTYEVSWVTSAHDALEKVQRMQPAVVILDVIMPGVDGFTVCRRIKADPDLDGTAVVLLTALDDALHEERGMAAGADAYLTKPFSPVGLIEVLDEVAEDR